MNTHLKRTLALLIGVPLSWGQTFGQQGESEAAGEEQVYELEALEVVAFQRDYLEMTAQTGIGFAVDRMQAPISTSTIPSDILDDQQVNRVENALRNVAGVQRYKTGNGGEEEFAIRGFDAGENIYKDGVRINSRFNASNIATTETANIERIDVLMGVGSILYGQGLPGGVVNYVTKKPQFESFGSLEMLYGSWDNLRIEGDATGPIGNADEATFAYRIVAAFEDSEDFRDYIARDRAMIAPSLLWQASERTQILLSSEFLDDNYTTDRGQILDGNGTDGYRYSERLNPSQFFGIPGHNTETEVEATRFDARLTHYLNAAWQTELIASTTDVDKTNVDSSPSFIGPGFQTIADNGDTAIQPRFSVGDGSADSFVWNNYFSFQPEGERGWRHRAQISLSHERLQTSNSNFRGSKNVIFNVVDGTYRELDFTLNERNPSIRETREQGILVQDLISISEQTDLLIGARYSNHRFEAFGRGLDSQESEALTPRAGIVYRTSKNLALYGNVALGYLPSEAVDIDGEILDPEHNQQYELGLKWTNSEESLALSAALYQITRQDIAGVDPATIGAAETVTQNFGDARSRGFELQFNGQLTTSWRLIGGYSYVDSEITRAVSQRGSQGLQVDVTGNREPGVPEHSFNFWSVYEVQEGSLEGFGFGGGAFASSDVFVSRENVASYAGWLQVDAVAYYKRENWKAQLNIENLFDKTYNLAQSSVPSDFFGAIRVGTSRPLNATLSFAYAF